MKKFQKDGWLCIINEEAETNRIDIEEESKNVLHGTIGKYLFFSYNKEELINLCEIILKEYNLFRGKVPFEKTTKEYVLCVYDVRNRFSQELSKFSNDNIRYKFWKPNSATIRGVYSKF
jgi:hypothetical protein